MEIEAIRRVSLARHFFELANRSLLSKNDMHLFSAVNLAQDAIETFLNAVADHLQVSLKKNSSFDQYFVVIDEKLHPQQLPFKTRLLRLNLVRVESKHHGIQPDRGECARLLTSAREFLNEVSLQIFGASFSSISTVDLLAEGECKQLLLAAQEALDANDLRECAILCRKAMYVEVEWAYDISKFKNGPVTGLLNGWSHAPIYARSKSYIDENVLDPTDYIVLDHSRVDHDLLKSGVDTIDFWNVWRLTPEVYKDSGRWYVREDFSKLDPEVLAENAEHIFSAAMDVALALHNSRRAIRVHNTTKFSVSLSRGDVPVYLKADRASKVVDTIESSSDPVEVNSYIQGLNDEGPYWHVMAFKDGKFLSGYLHDEDVQRND